MKFISGKMKIVLISFICIFIVLSVPSLAISEETSRVQSDLELAEKDMQEMLDQGLTVTRYNDTLIITKQIFDAQVALENAGGKPSYYLVYEKLEELEDIKQKAFKNIDELNALKSAINQTEGIDLTQVLDLYEQAENEFEAERYEKSLELIDMTYKRLSELKALQTKVKAFYEATSRNIVNFFKERWKEIASIVAAIIIIVILTHNRIACWRIKRKMKQLELRKKSIKELIKKTQKDYFEKGELSENTFRIRTKKYAELIRDLNRQIPLLREELVIRSKRRF